MPYLRQRPRLAPTGRVAVKLTAAQRDLLLGPTALPKDLGHALHRAALREGKLTLRLDRASLDALITAAARVRTPDRKSERALDTLLRYLESRADRFAEPEEPEPAPLSSPPPVSPSAE